MTKHIQKYIKDLEEESLILKLLKEIEEAIQFSLDPYRKGSMVIHYLEDYRRRRAITREGINTFPFSKDLLLMQKIKNLHETEIYFLCNEIAQIKKTGVEKVSGMTLYVFLDRYLNSKQKKKKRQLPGFLIN